MGYFTCSAQTLVMRGIFYLPSIDTGTRSRQFNVSSERHPAEILLMKVLVNFGFTARGSNLGPLSQQASVLTTRPPSCQYWANIVYVSCTRVVLYLYKISALYYFLCFTGKCPENCSDTCFKRLC